MLIQIWICCTLYMDENIEHERPLYASMATVLCGADGQHEGTSQSFSAGHPWGLFAIIKTDWPHHVAWQLQTGP